LFETRDGWRYTLWVTNLPAATRGWRSQPACIDATHRVHARVEDRIRTGKDCGIGHFPSKILHAAARLVRGARRRQLRIPATWPCADDITAAWQQITALPQAP
jgi:hypothetical protein